MNNLQTLDEHLNEASSAFKHAVQTALKAAGYNLKQSEVKIGAKKVSGMGTKITLNGEMIGFDDEIPKMIANFTKSIKEDPEKYGLKESVNEAKKYDWDDILDVLMQSTAVGGAGKILDRINDRDPEVKELLAGRYKSFPDFAKAVQSMYNLKESVNKAKKKIKPGTEIHWPTNHKNKALHGRSGYIEKIKGNNALMNMHDNADDESMWIPVPIKDLPVNEGLSNYSLLDFFKEMQSFPAAGVDRDDIKDASKPKNKKKTVKNTPALKSLLDQWMSGRFDEDPGYLVNDLRDLLESVNEASPKQYTNIEVLKPVDIRGTRVQPGNYKIKYENGRYILPGVGKFSHPELDKFDIEHYIKTKKIKVESVNEGDQMNGEYLMQMLKVQADDIKRDEPKTAAALMYIYDRIYQSARDEDLSAEDVHDFLNEPRGRKHSLNLPEWMILDLFVESFILQEDGATNMPEADPPIPLTPGQKKKKKEEEDEEAEEMAATDAADGAGPPKQGGFAKAAAKQMKDYMENLIPFNEFVNEGEILVWDEMEKPFDDLKNALDKITKENTDPKWSKALLSIWNQIEKAETNLNNYDKKLGAIPTQE
jgi:hypothetical protein